MKTLNIAVLFSILLGSSVASAGFPGFVNPEPQAEKIFVFDNGIVCAKAPCPSFTAILETGETVDLSGVKLPEGTDPVLENALHLGGLLVEGTIESQSFPVGGSADVLLVDAVLDSAKTFSVSSSGIVCITAPCPSIQAVDEAGQATLLTNVSLDVLFISPEDAQAFMQNLFSGTVKATGYILASQEGLGEVTLFVTRIVQ
jgi:hypothetical protein